jgi:methylated-DNA-[protein]-cysteine S-methyltransferase
MVQFATYSSPFGPVQIGHRESRIVSIRCGSSAAPHMPSEVSELANLQLQEYFAGKRTAFDLPLDPAGTPFQLAVWNSMREIPYGETRTYGQLAAAIGRPAASRAVGQAANRNPIWIVIPCHRIVGSNHSLTGYAGGLSMKGALLELEKS